MNTVIQANMHIHPGRVVYTTLGQVLAGGGLTAHPLIQGKNLGIKIKLTHNI